MEEENKDFKFSADLVTGYDMSEILFSVKSYVDYKDFRFIDVDKDGIPEAGDGEIILPDSSIETDAPLSGGFVREDDVQFIIDKYFTIPVKE